MQGNDTNKSSNRQATEGFFIVNLDVWESLFNTIDEKHSDSDVNRVMATYLTLCCGTGGDHVTSSWSSGAVYKHTGISPKVATRAIKILSDNGFISIDKAAEKNKFPVYKISHFGIDTKSDDAKNIFIPNGVVTGVSGEDSPLKRLVNEQNKYLLYLFIRLYYFQDKYLDVISPNIVSSALNNENELQADMVYSVSNLLNVWCIEDSPAMTGYPKSHFYDFNIWKDDADDPFINEKSGSGYFWGFFSTLMDLDLITQTLYAFNGDEVHQNSYTADSDDVVSQLDFIAELYSKPQWALFDAILQSLGDNRERLVDEVNEYKHKVVLPAKYKKVHFQQFYQLRYRTRLGESKIRYAQDKAVTRELAKLLEVVTKGGN